MRKTAGIGIGIAVVAIIGVAFGSTMMGKPVNDFGLPPEQDNKMKLSDEINIKVSPAESTQSQPTPSTEETPVEGATPKPKTIQVNVSDGVGTSDK